MKVGVFFEGINGPALIAAAQRAEQLGFESLWRPDHLVLPVAIASTYPYAADGNAPLQPDWPIVDAFTIFAYVAASTSTIKFGTAVYILPLRDPVVTARTVLGVDYLSRGRMMLGVGAGWLEDEFRFAGQDFHTRGARMDECIELLRALWTEKTVDYRGKHYQVGPLHFEPKPVSRPHPPIVVGGESPAAFRRVARLGDGWYAINHPPEEMKALIAGIHEQRARYGRAGLPFEVTMNARATVTPDELARYAEVGVDRVVVSLWRSSKDALPNLERFAETTLAKVPA
ncbi:MAG: LLM class F420-dependent oxidoreductase [Dehalococcoidia bacterium]|nr:LLM class F420-dependent oxidoreductase [Dehalococcoidia bacterium]